MTKTHTDLLDHLPDAVILTDERGVITGANSQAATLFGYPPGALVGMDIDLLVPEEARPAHREHRSLYYSAPAIRRMGGRGTLAGRRSDGSVFPADISLSPYRSADGPLIISVVRDVSERVRLEEARRESEERYRALVDLSPEAIVVHASGMIVYVNEATVRLLMAPSREALIGRSFLDFVPPEYKPDVIRRMALPEEEVRKEGPLLVKATRADGQDFYLEAIGSRITYRGVPAAQVILRDISDRVRAYEEISASREQLRSLATHLQSVRESERGAIAREIHDELGGALTALKLDLASFEDVLPGEESHDLRAALVEKLESMSSLIDSTVQTMRRIITQLRPVLLDSLGLSAAIEWLAEDFEHRTGIACRARISGEAFAHDHDRATAVYRIVQETLTNVARHSGATQVDIAMESDAAAFRLSVSDNGRGITGEQMDAGVSFGIIGMKERALILGGELTIAAGADGGTRVALVLPLDAAAPDLAPRTSPPGHV
ncbi:MAG TPA: PAS domain-containing sensor histidine kinase [Bacteroidota bacterium]|nr:PAS domain-containing sensor histidine kinase [Bacteroidota bacterium]